MKSSIWRISVLASFARAQISNEAELSSALSSLSAGPASAFATGYASLLYAIQPSPAPTSLEDMEATLQQVSDAYPTDSYGATADMLLSGLTGGQSLQDIQNGYGSCNSDSNSNTQEPSTPVYPQKGSSDAPYDVSEDQLRSAIYIPSGFTYGSITPLIFVPGTGAEGCDSFSSNLGQLFTGSSFADPVYVNVPDSMLDDIQTNAEYIAYAINYISGISNDVNVAVMTWSQGSVASQWAFKYWPSTRNVTSDMINISSDYHGTEEIPPLCYTEGVGCAPAVLQQAYTSNFIATLRNNGGDSAYVPTTEIHSIFDEVVEPQSDPDASATIGDGNGVAVSNNEIQEICPDTTPAGSANLGHEGALYNAVSWALAADALQNDGPADVTRSGAIDYCGDYVAPGLTLSNVFAVEGVTLLAGYNIVSYPNKVTSEPPIKSYAAGDQP